jgi:transposase-like protein
MRRSVPRRTRSKYTDEQILAIVKEGEAGRKVADLCRTHGITEQTYYPLEGEVRWHGAQ